MTASIGAIIAERFKVIKPLGEGGMGIVYLVEDLDLGDELLAFKLLSSSISKDKRQVARFKSEVLLARKLTHENIVRVHALGETEDDQYFITMEYVKGQSLGDMLANGERPSFDETLRILFSIAKALKCAHAQGVIHRDLKRLKPQLFTSTCSPPDESQFPLPAEDYSKF